MGARVNKRSTRKSTGGGGVRGGNTNKPNNKTNKTNTTKTNVGSRKSSSGISTPNSTPSPTSNENNNSSFLGLTPEDHVEAKTYSDATFTDRDFALCNMEKCEYSECINLQPDGTFGTDDCEFLKGEFYNCRFEGCTFVTCRHYDVAGTGFSVVAVNEFYQKFGRTEKEDMDGGQHGCEWVASAADGGKERK